LYKDSKTLATAFIFCFIRVRKKKLRDFFEMAFKVTKETMKALCRDVKLTKPQATEKKSLIVLRLFRKIIKKQTSQNILVCASLVLINGR